jgi:hypothetical protein
MSFTVFYFTVKGNKLKLTQLSLREIQIMAYIERDVSGNIIGVHEEPQDNAKEILALDDPELLNYLVESASSDDAKTILNTSDFALIRVLEDLVNTLIDKNIILFTDLPLAAREKLANREKIRSHLNSLDNLISDSEDQLL